MKKIRNKSKKGFTLVELIVVLVILAILAAMLVPALTGWIRKAREEKDYQTASTVYTAVQALATQAYAKLEDDTATVKASDISIADVRELTDLSDDELSAVKVSFEGKTATIAGIAVTINGSTYTYSRGASTWGTDDIDGVTSIGD